VPFQRYGDAPRGADVGLGPAVARGFAEAMDGTLNAEDTPAAASPWCSPSGAVDSLHIPARLAEPERQAS
jgi:two-component system, OmpR family, sensor histidine kinase KdpD